MYKKILLLACAVFCALENKGAEFAEVPGITEAAMQAAQALAAERDAALADAEVARVQAQEALAVAKQLRKDLSMQQERDGEILALAQVERDAVTAQIERNRVLSAANEKLRQVVRQKDEDFSAMNEQALAATQELETIRALLARQQREQKEREEEIAALKSQSILPTRQKGVFSLRKVEIAPSLNASVLAEIVSESKKKEADKVRLDELTQLSHISQSSLEETAQLLSRKDAELDQLRREFAGMQLRLKEEKELRKLAQQGVVLVKQALDGTPFAADEAGFSNDESDEG